VAAQLAASQEEPPGTHWIGSWAGPSAGLDEVEIFLAPIGTRTPTPQPSSPYQLRYSALIIIMILIYLFCCILFETGMCITYTTKVVCFIEALTVLITG
jgi:hypothetical protein